MRLPRLLVPLLAALLSAIVSSLALVAPASAATPLPKLRGCDVKAALRPHTLWLSCDSTWELKGLRWTRWTATGATGTGTESVNDCKPDCADGSWRSYPVRLALSGPIDTEASGRIFGRIVLTYPKHDAQGHRSRSIDMVRDYQVVPIGGRPPTATELTALTAAFTAECASRGAKLGGGPLGFHVSTVNRGWAWGEGVCTQTELVAVLERSGGAWHIVVDESGGPVACADVEKQVPLPVVRDLRILGTDATGMETHC
ncbi:hypothetical protein EV189_2279 [Motilibacter rhizosphaerae]|uniref:Secreted protein n=1 Tax=Motilibacter rhizosphaerae TaxID=598652 RepID=A0A4Q7NNW9_9ACTN|nr:hypothetical protein [Motilibacter rhizosphaerae]RZS86863.1 hypothetical protein EV189_2279 [Motilibacter rhizosphaerae]